MAVLETLQCCVLGRACCTPLVCVCSTKHFVWIVSMWKKLCTMPFQATECLAMGILDDMIVDCQKTALTEVWGVPREGC